MEAEQNFRLALIIPFVLTILITGYHRWNAAKSRETISRKLEGIWFAVLLRCFGLILFVSVFAYLAVPSSMRWGQLPIPDGIRWGGLVLGGGGTVMMYWTLSHLGTNLTDTVVTRKDATLVTSGPYRWVRHPFYVAAACTMASATLLSANFVIGVASLLVMGMLVYRTRLEEQMLIERFGQAYVRYMQRTGRFAPRFGTTNPNSPNAPS
jgi:protein-S-isoprenylcysteine O-methyltransferase Ste14